MPPEIAQRGHRDRESQKIWGLLRATDGYGVTPQRQREQVRGGSHARV